MANAIKHGAGLCDHLNWSFDDGSEDEDPDEDEASESEEDGFEIWG